MKKQLVSTLLALCMILALLPGTALAEANNTAIGQFYILKPTSADQDSSFTWDSGTGVGNRGSWIYAGAGTLDVGVDNPSMDSKYPAVGGKSKVLAQPDTLPDLTMGDTTYTYDPDGDAGTYSVVWERLTYCNDWNDGTTNHDEACWHVDGYVVLNASSKTGHFYILKPDSAGQFHSFTWDSDIGSGDSGSWFYAGAGTLDMNISRPSMSSKYPVSDENSTVLIQPDTMPQLPVGNTTYTYDPNGGAGTYSVVWERFAYCSDWNDGTTAHSEINWHVDGYAVLNTGTGTPAQTTPAQTANAVLSSQKLSVNGKNIDCEKYNIGGSNYFKLRDLACVLSGTAAQFEVGFDAAASAVSITTGAAYTPNGTELASGVDNANTAQRSSQTIMIDGVERSDLTAYNIGGSNFFQLRELGTALGFEVDFDAASNTAIVRSAQS